MGKYEKADLNQLLKDCFGPMFRKYAKDIRENAELFHKAFGKKGEAMKYRVGWDKRGWTVDGKRTTNKYKVLGALTEDWEHLLNIRPKGGDTMSIKKKATSKLKLFPHLKEAVRTIPELSENDPGMYDDHKRHLEAHKELERMVKEEQQASPAGKPIHDLWAHRSQLMICSTCIYYVTKIRIDISSQEIGRCRHNAPTITGYPVVFPSDWCGQHKMDENKI